MVHEQREEERRSWQERWKERKGVEKQGAKLGAHTGLWVNTAETRKKPPFLIVNAELRLGRVKYGCEKINQRWKQDAFVFCSFGVHWYSWVTAWLDHLGFLLLRLYTSKSFGRDERPRTASMPIYNRLSESTELHSLKYERQRLSTRRYRVYKDEESPTECDTNNATDLLLQTISILICFKIINDRKIGAYCTVECWWVLLSKINPAGANTTFLSSLLPNLLSYIKRKLAINNFHLKLISFPILTAWQCWGLNKS